MHDYFVRRVAPRPIDYEEAYWGTVVDPDGNVRDRREERAQVLADLAQELQFLNGLPSGRLLDVGCGLGYLLSGLTGPWERHGIEVSAFAAKHAAQWGRIHVGELADAHYPSEYFDVVVMHHVIEHMADPIAAIREVRRILKPGGRLILGTPDFDSGCARRFGANYRLLHDPTHISLFTNESMHRFLRDHGFRVGRVEYPFFETRHFTPDNLLRLFDTDKVSPPFYGNFMTFYCEKRGRGAVHDAFVELGRLAHATADASEAAIERAGDLLAHALAGAGRVVVAAACDAASAANEVARKLERGAATIAVVELSSRSDWTRRLAEVAGTDRRWPAGVVIVVGAAGPDESVAAAITEARRLGLATVAVFSGRDDLPEKGDTVWVRIPSDDPRQVQALLPAVLQAVGAQAAERLPLLVASRT